MYSSKHGFIERCLKDVLAEQGIEYVAPGFERAPKKRPSTTTVVANDVTTEYITHEYIEGGGEDNEGLGDETIVFVALDDSQAQVFVYSIECIYVKRRSIFLICKRRERIFA